MSSGEKYVAAAYAVVLLAVLVWVAIIAAKLVRLDRETGENFNEGVHLALGEAGYLAREWKPETEGGFNRVRRRIWELEKRRAHVPWVTEREAVMMATSRHPGYARKPAWRSR